MRFLSTLMTSFILIVSSSMLLAPEVSATTAALSVSSSTAQELTVNYAAQDFKGAPKFKVLAYKDGSTSPIWTSKIITAEGGVDTERYGGQISLLKWKNKIFQIPSNINFDYFRIHFLNDKCCGVKKGNKTFGDRNFYVKWISFEGNRYWASRGKQKTCRGGGAKAGEMFCVGKLDITVANNAAKVIYGDVLGSNERGSPAPSGIDTICGFQLEKAKARSELVAIQKALAKRKLYSGSIDGVFGVNSCKALNKWAKCENLGQQTINDGAVSKLTRSNPSERDLSCYWVNDGTAANLYKPNVNFISFSARPFTNVESDGRLSLHVRVCGKGVSVDNKNTKGDQCARLKSEKRSGRAWKHSIIFDSQNFSVFPIRTNDQEGSNFKFWLREKPHWDTQNFESFLKKAPKDGQTVIGGLCERFASKPFMNKVVVGAIERASTIGILDERVMNTLQKEQSINALISIAKRCQKTAELGLGQIFVTSGTVYSPKPNQSASCSKSKLQVRLDQNVLKSLDLYTSTVDGISGPNYRKAVAAGEKLLGQWADSTKDCLSMSERKVLGAVVDARKRGSSCEYLPNSIEIKNRFNGLKSAGVIKKTALNHEKTDGLIWMIDKVSALEMQLSFSNFYNGRKSSLRDCRLSDEELQALKPPPPPPPEPKAVVIAADSLSMTAIKTAKVTTLSLLAQGSDLETSLMTKSIFGLNNQVKMDVVFDMSKGSPVLDFIVSEGATKINLNFYDTETKNRDFAKGLSELILLAGKEINDEKPNNGTVFFIRMLDSGKSNIDTGDFGKLLGKMPRKDHLILSALCGHIAGISTSDEGFEAQFSSSDHKAAFRSSLFSNPQVRDVVNKLAAQCVAEVRSIGGVEASFNIHGPVGGCTDAQVDQLASLDAQIAAEQKSLLGLKDEINQLQIQRPLFEFKKCNAYSNDVASTDKRLESLQEEVAQSETLVSGGANDLNAGLFFAARLERLKAPADICLGENKTLRSEVNDYMLELNPVIVGIQCPDLDDGLKNPMQTVIDEINADILALLEVHISTDGIAALEAERDNKLQELRDLVARLAKFEQSKASPEQIQAQINTNTSLRQTIDDIEARSWSLENEIRALNGVLADNAGMIEDINILNQHLVELSTQKDRSRSVLDEVKSKALGAQAIISQRNLEISKLEAQILDLDIQIEASSSTAGNLVAEVVQLGQDMVATTKRVTTLEGKVSEAKVLIDNANGAIAQKSQEVSKLDAELNKRVAEASTLSGSVSTLAPQADAAEITVEGMRASLETDFVSIGQYQEQAARLNELTQAVTERTNLIRELRSDLGSIEQEEQLLIKMCITDAQCKATMGERLGVEQ